MADALLAAARKAQEIAFDWLHTDPDNLPADSPLMSRAHDRKAGWEAMKRIHDILAAALAEARVER